MNTFPEAGRRGRIAKGLLLASALTAVLLVVAVACGGGDDNNDTPGNNQTPVMQTFTPTTEADATNRAATQEAFEELRETAVAGTATWRAENPPPPTPTRDPNATPEDEGLRPPMAFLSYEGETMEGVFGNFSFLDLTSGAFGNVQAPFYQVGEFGLTVGRGAELTFSMQPAFMNPTTMDGAPEILNAEIYTWDGNNAFPTTMDGQVGEERLFVPNLTPILTQPMQVDNPVVIMPADPNRYVVRIQVVWPKGTAQENPPQQDIYAFYAFTVYVQ